MDATGWDQRYRTKELIWNVGPNQFLPGLVDGLAAGRALDVATGEGRNAVWLAQQGWEVTGVDFSTAGIDKARAVARQHDVAVQWTVADLTSWSPPLDHFDLIIEFYLHVPAPARSSIHRNLVKGLAPGGRYVIVGHDLSNLTKGVGGPPDPGLLFTPADLAADLPALQIERAEIVRRPVGDAVALDAVLVATRPN